jgi:hypothetical protein
VAARNGDTAMRRIGSEFQVNALTAGAEGSSQIVTFADGKFGVVYTINNYWIEDQLINRDGTSTLLGSYLVGQSGSLGGASPLVRVS